MCIRKHKKPKFTIIKNHSWFEEEFFLPSHEPLNLTKSRGQYKKMQIPNEQLGKLRPIPAAE